jgi:hypothetical protein
LDCGLIVFLVKASFSGYFVVAFRGVPIYYTHSFAGIGFIGIQVLPYVGESGGDARGTGLRNRALWTWTTT